MTQHGLTSLVVGAFVFLAAACQPTVRTRLADWPCDLTTTLRTGERAPALAVTSTEALSPRITTMGGDLWVGRPLPANESESPRNGTLVRMRAHVVDSAAPTFVEVAAGDTVRGFIVAFPRETPFALAVASHEERLGVPAYVQGQSPQHGAWRSAQWETPTFFVRVDSGAAGGSPQICAGAFQR